MQHTKPKPRVGLYLTVETRNRLNRFIAEQRLATDEFMSQSMAVELLLDHYKATAPQPERDREFVTA
jgi:uncharacterized protein YciW